MKASLSDTSEDSDAFELDYEDFFSVLMYYGGMSKKEIYGSSRPFLYGIYKKYGNRACENLGVSANSEKEKNENIELTEADYPATFEKLFPVEREQKQSASDYLKEFEGLIPAATGNRLIEL